MPLAPLPRDQDPPSLSTPVPPRHRACNMFLEAYKLSWLVPEEHPFEDRMIDDLSVS